MPPGGQDPTSTRMGGAGFSRCSPVALLLCSKMTLFCPFSSCLMLTQTSVHISPPFSGQQLVPGHQSSRARTPRWQTHPERVCFLGGSRLILHLISPPPGLSPQSLCSVLCTFSITQMAVVFVGFHSLLIKPIFIQYAVCEYGSATCCYRICVCVGCLQSTWQDACQLWGSCGRDVKSQAYVKLMYVCLSYETFVSCFLPDQNVSVNPTLALVTIPNFSVEKKVTWAHR